MIRKNPKNVLIHDSARPFASNKLIFRLIKYLNRNLKTLLISLKKHKNANPIIPEATYLLWLHVKNPNNKDLQSHFEKYGVGINDGAEFGKKDHIRINFATTYENVKKATKRIEEALINL